MTREIQIPHDVEAEEAVLGSLLIDPELAFVVVEDALGPEDFFIQKNAWVYEAIQKLNRAGIVPDYIARPLACAVVFRVCRVASRLGGARCVPAPLRRGRLIEGLCSISGSILLIISLAFAGVGRFVPRS